MRNAEYPVTPTIQKRVLLAIQLRDKSPQNHDFEVQSSFELEIFRLRENIKNAVMLTHTAFFCELLSENIKSKPNYPYAEPPFGALFYNSYDYLRYIQTQAYCINKNKREVNCYEQHY